MYFRFGDLTSNPTTPTRALKAQPLYTLQYSTCLSRAWRRAPGASVKQTVVDRVSGASGRDSHGQRVAAKTKL